MNAVGTVKIDDRGIPWLIFWGIGLMVQSGPCPHSEEGQD